MKKQYLTRALVLMLAVVLILGAMPVSAAGDGVTIKLHYHRPDGDYTEWGVWFWALGKEGADYPFAEENGEMIATYQTAPGTTQVGFIVKLPNWAAKDVEQDQFIDITAYTAGTVHIYVESGVAGYETRLEGDVVSGVKVKSALYRDGEGFLIAMTAPVNAAKVFQLEGPQGQMALGTIYASDENVYTICPEEDIDLTAAYTLIYDGERYPIQMPNIYSTPSFEEAYTYTGSDLGATWTAEQTTFRLWAPTATGVRVNLYASGTPGTQDLLEQLDMTPDVNGTWVLTHPGDLNGVYYTYQVEVNGQSVEACDPYARATGVNGQRAMVIDLDATDPAGWESDTDPHAGASITDAVIYELHIRDLSMDESSGITNKGKFLGLTETGTTNSQRLPTGLDHIKRLGITHLHLLPVYDYASVDESDLETPQFNWGYDPLNYNVPESSYSTDPYHGEVRVQEMKQMVKALHGSGISVVMDVVYNHVYNAERFCFNQIVPGYFSRISDDGAYSNGSGCGNDTATERAMVKKYIVDSVTYWADEYHIDGFRFDLVGLIDTETIHEILTQVHKTHPNVIFYGEGWTMTTNLTKEGYTLTTQVNSTQVPGFAFFSDDIRDALKGSVFDNHATGYIANTNGYVDPIRNYFVAGARWCKDPTQVINYASCHDNMSLFDRLAQSCPGDSFQDRVKMNNLAAAIYMTSQGTPFLQAGEEMLRSKPLADGGFDSNSYASSDAVNSLKWDDLNNQDYQAVVAYYQGLIAFRQAHPALRMTSAQEISEHITTLSGLDTNVAAFHIAAGANGEENELFVVFNPRKEATTLTLPQGSWDLYINGTTAGTQVLSTVTGELTVDAISACVLVRSADAPAETVPEQTQAPVPADPQPKGNSLGLTLGLVALCLLAFVLILIYLRRRKGGSAL